MTKEVQFRRFFRLTSMITDTFPAGGAKFLDLSFKNLLGNMFVMKAVAHQAGRRLKGAGRFRKFLVAADLNIGDAVIAQGGIAALREIFPDAEIDCVVKKSTMNLFLGDPDILNLYPVYVGAPYPADSDLRELSRIARSKDYDVIVNFSPMIGDKVFGSKRVVNYSLMAAQLIRNEGIAGAGNNVVYQAHNFVGTVFQDHANAELDSRFNGARIFLSGEALEEASAFLLSQDLSREQQLIMFNPDASAKYTRMPFDLQLNLLNKLSDFDVTILLGSGHVERYIEHELVYSLPPGKRRKVVIVPRATGLDVYAALVDLSDVYVSGDTGPLHLAAARKFLRGSGQSLRNRTAVISIFGGTPPKIYGYDSSAPGFFPANQDAPSKTFVAGNTCRNITCINKMAKTCKDVRCFLSLDPNEVVSEISVHLDAARRSRHRERLQILAK